MKRNILICIVLLACLASLLLPGCSKKSGSISSLPGTTAPTSPSTQPTEPIDPNAPVTVYVITGRSYQSDASGTQVDFFFVYDAAGRLLEVSKQNAQGGKEVVVAFTYDAQGNCLSYKNALENIDRTYDSQGNLLTDRSSSFTTVYTYNEAGQCIQQEHLTPDGNRISLSRYTYDARGNLICDTLERGGSVFCETRHTYDENDRHLTQTYYRNGIISPEGPSYVWEYDAQGNLVMEQLSYGELPGRRMEYTYDANGNTLSSCQYNSDGSSFQFYYTYDANGNLLHTKDITVDTKGKQYIRNFYYEYDAHGNRVLQHDINAHGNERFFRWEYNKNGLLVGRSFMSPDTAYQYTWTYDEQGNKLTETKTGNYPHTAVWVYDEENRVLSVKYSGSIVSETTHTYGQHGNKIQTVTVANGETRTITYTYTACTVTPEEAAVILAQQAEILRYLEEPIFSLDGYTSPTG